MQRWLAQSEALRFQLLDKVYYAGHFRGWRRPLYFGVCAFRRRLLKVQNALPVSSFNPLTIRALVVAAD
jgi:hypothetical protein